MVKLAKLKHIVARTVTRHLIHSPSLLYPISKLPLDLWVHYALCLISGYSIPKSAKVVGVCVKTSFYMRHKLLNCIRAYIGVGHVEGIVELDETMVAESFKGNHEKSGFTLPRESRKRGEEIHTRGISNEYVCIASLLIDMKMSS